MGFSAGVERLFIDCRLYDGYFLCHNLKNVVTLDKFNQAVINSIGCTECFEISL